MRRLPPAAAYEPGAFFRRELPLLRAALDLVRSPPDIVVIDGFVWLDAENRPGLGAHLHDAVKIPVIGVAKTAFRSCESWSAATRRGKSTRPLFVTAAGLDQAEAAAMIAAMHGAHRIPTLVALADRAARETLAAR